jgi:hypothetical protein
MMEDFFFLLGWVARCGMVQAAKSHRIRYPCMRLEGRGRKTELLSNRYFKI